MIPQQDNIVDCPECGQPMDVSSLPPYTNAVCPACQTMTRVKTRMGPYRIIGRQGKGGMSVVFRAEDSVLGREVALKILNDTCAGDSLRSERFEREAQIMARVSHENLVKVYAVGRDQGLFYIAMELVEGSGLDALISTKGRVPEDEVLRLSLDIVRGLDAAWNAGLMHRDIKPANVILSSDGVVKIVDFGLSLLHSESDMDQEIWVTPYYAAPETLLREEEDFRTDMYALGATMYHLLVGEPPRVDASQPSDVLLENKKNLPRIEQVVNDISPMTCFIVNRLMSFDREKRFSSYAELMEVLDQALTEYTRKIQESGLTWAERVVLEARRARRKKRGFIVASSITVAVAMVLSICCWETWREDEASSTTAPVLSHPFEEEMTLEDKLAKESRLERGKRFGRLFHDAQNSLNRGYLVKASAMFGDLADQPACPLSTSLWAGLNQVLCMWVCGQFPEGMERLGKMVRKMENCEDSEERERSKDIGLLIKHLSSTDWPSRMSGLRPHSDLAVHYYVGMALKSWHLAGKWQEYGSFLNQVAADATDDGDESVRELASAWLSNLEAYTEQYENLKRVQNMPEKTVAEVDAKRSAASSLQNQMKTEEVSSSPSMYASLEEILDHLRVQYQVARDWEAAEAVKAAERKQQEERQKKLEEKEKREALLAAQSRSDEDVCQEAAEVMKKTGDYEKVIDVYKKAEETLSSPAAKNRLAIRREMTKRMLPLFSRLEKLLPALLSNNQGRTLALKDGSKVLLKKLNGHLLIVESQGNRNGKSVHHVCWDDLPFNSLYVLARECRRKHPEEFSPMSETYAKPLLIFGKLTGTISETQQRNALLQMDRPFIRTWDSWMRGLEERDEPPEDDEPLGWSL